MKFKRELSNVLRLLLAGVFFVVGSASIQAQDVTVSPKTGAMIPAVHDESLSSVTEVGWSGGGFAMWRHNQLPLSVAVSYNADLNEDGLLKYHNNLMYPNKTGNAKTNDDSSGDSYFVFLSGYNSGDGTGNDLAGYLTISLPRGMRFTRYRIVLKNNVASVGGYDANTSTDMNFTECTVDDDGTWSRHTAANTAAEMGKINTSSTTEYTIERTSTTPTDMGNILYFRLETDGSTSNFQMVAIKSILLEFTSEAPVTATVAPTAVSTIGVSYATASFNTVKQDLGEITSHTYDGKTRNGYTETNVKNITSNMWLYEQEAIGTDGKFPTSDIGNKTIQSALSDGKYYYYLRPTAKSSKTYYVETPTEATDQTGKTAYLNYRIIGATIHYTNKAEVASTYITYTKSGGGTTYYLQRDMTWSSTNKVVWNNNGGILSTLDVDDGSTYYLMVGNNFRYGYYLTTTTLQSSANQFTVEDSQITIEDNEYNTYYVLTDGYGSSYNETYISTSTSGWNYTPTLTSEGNESTALDDYNLTIYGTDGDTPKKTINVSGEGSYELTNLNNDAVKFQVSGDALVYVDLQVEYLDPFVSSMQVEMKNTNTNHTFDASQTFTSTDFVIGGGNATFAIPSEFENDTFSLTFNNLISDYADETYRAPVNGSAQHHSRYNFVKSAYYNKHGESNNNIYNDRKNVASAEGYEDKITVSTVGNVPFKFNNADTYESEITGSATSTSLKEYPFTLERYANQASWSNDTEKYPNGTFTEKTVVPNTDTHITAYLFVTDETRYNIAPTTAEQHRMYAFYGLEVNIDTRKYATKAELKKIYDNSYYDDNSTGAFYGAEIYTTLEDQPNTRVTGYSSIRGAVEAVQEACKDEGVSTDKILYLDMGSQLAGVFATSDVNGSWDDINKAFTAKNLLVFLPQINTIARDNYASAEVGTTTDYHAGRNIILTDLQPFYSPYDISMSTTNYARYDRLISNARNTRVEWATVILPFTLNNLSNGVMTDEDGNKFTVLEMNASNALNDVNKPTGYFTAITGRQTAANTPYALHIDTNNRTSDNTCSFTLKQNGSNIMATPTNTEATDKTNVAITTTESSTGTVSNATYTFNMSGTYAGRSIPKNTEPVFYFTHDGFYNSKALSQNWPDAYVRPFRAYYNYTSDNGAKISMFSIVIGENPGGEATGIDNVPTFNTEITTGRGYITITAGSDKRYRVSNVAGMSVGNLNLHAGESQTINVPAGLYIVNGIKVIVK